MNRIILILFGLIFVGSICFAEDAKVSKEPTPMSNASMNHSRAMQLGGTMGKANTPTTEKTSKLMEVGNKICPVSGNKVDDGKMGKAVKYEYNGKIYNLCCKMCIKDFKENPEKYSKIAEKEVTKEKTMWTPTKEKKHR